MPQPRRCHDATTNTVWHAATSSTMVAVMRQAVRQQENGERVARGGKKSGPACTVLNSLTAVKVRCCRASAPDCTVVWHMGISSIDHLLLYLRLVVLATGEWESVGRWRRGDCDQRCASGPGTSRPPQHWVWFTAMSLISRCRIREFAEQYA